MINAILMIGSTIASAAILVLGLVFTFSPLGSIWVGLTLAVMGAVLASACVPTCLAEFRWWRHRRHLREQAAQSRLGLSAQRTWVPAHAQEPKLRLVKATEEKPAEAGQRQPPAAA